MVVAFAAFCTAGFGACKATAPSSSVEGAELPNELISFSKSSDIKFNDSIEPFELKAKLFEGVLSIADISWAVGKGEDIVEISGEGDSITVTPTGKAGDAMINAMLTPHDGIEFGDLELEASFELSVIERPVVTVNPIGDIMLNEGDQPKEKQISAKYEPDSISAFDPVFEWEFVSGGDKAELEEESGADVTLKATSPGTGILKVKLTLLDREFESAEAAFSIKKFDPTQEPHQSIMITGAPASMIATDTSAEFSVSFTPAIAVYETIDWVYDKDKFTLDSAVKDKIKLTAKPGSAGSYTIKAISSLDKSVEASFNITVTPVTVSVKAAAGKSDSIYKGEETKYEATVNAQNKTVTWSVANTSAAVSVDGVITNPQAVGASTSVAVTAKSSADPSASGSKNVTLKPPAYTLVYDKNATAATGTMKNESKTFGTPYTLTANTYLNNGFSFVGWHTTNTGSNGVSYIDKQANVNIEPSKNGATVTLYAQWEESFTPAAGYENYPDLMIKFGIKSPGYSINEIMAQDVTNTLKKVSGYIKKQDPSIVNPVYGLGFIKLGDYINLKSIIVAEYNGNKGAVNLSNNSSGNDKLCILVAGINSYYDKNGNGKTTPHLVFHFKGFPGIARMEASDTNKNGYLNSEMRKYIIGNYWTALQVAGVPGSIVWNVSRRVPNKGPTATGTQTITDYLWLPTEWELLGPNGDTYGSSYADRGQENNGNQGFLGYYDTNYKRRKQDGKTDDYWTASPYSKDAESFCAIGYWGMSGWIRSSYYISGVAPAFCIK